MSNAIALLIAVASALFSLIGVVVALVVGARQLDMQKRQDAFVAKQDTLVRGKANLILSFADQQKEGDLAGIRVSDGLARVPLIIINDDDQWANDVVVELRLDPKTFIAISTSAPFLTYSTPDYAVWQIIFEHPIYPKQEIRYWLDMQIHPENCDSDAVVRTYWNDGVPSHKDMAQTFRIKVQQ
ncbi:MAG: hypothetical protein KGN02_01350 [bacterium]|nr:hypothetical protein [bacterium]